MKILCKNTMKKISGEIILRSNKWYACHKSNAYPDYPYMVEISKKIIIQSDSGLNVYYLKNEVFENYFYTEKQLRLKKIKKLL